MKKTFINTAIIVIVTIIALVVFNKQTSKNKTPNIYAEVKKGTFEITVTAAGELMAEKSIDIRGPQIGVNNQQQGNQGFQGGQGGRGGGGGGGFQGGQSRGGGSDMHAADLKIQDMVPEGTIVKEGDYVAQLDRTSYDNTLKDALDNLKELKTNLELTLLDTAVQLTSLRDDIKNQRSSVEEAVITLQQSQFEPPATIRQAEINLERQKRTLEQKERSYHLRVVQTQSGIARMKIMIGRRERLVSDLDTFLSNFTIKAPSAGMVIYKKERNGAKRKTGSTISPFDMIVATLPDLSSMISKIYVNEIDVSKVIPGQDVSLKVDAFPDKAFTGHIMSVANIGEQLPNSDAKMFETLIRIVESDPALRPTMTTGNKIIIKSISDAIYVPSESVQTGTDSIPFVYEKNKTKQIVILGESNEKNVIIEQGLEPGTIIYLTQPEKPEIFKLVGQNLIPLIREREKIKRIENDKYIKKV
jgi:HlyD family secretion protein